MFIMSREGLKTQCGRMFSSIDGAIGLDQRVMLFPIKKLAAASPTDQFSVESRWFYMQDGPGCEYEFREPGIHQETCLSCCERD